MKLVTKADLETYLYRDCIGEQMRKVSDHCYSDLTCQRWLMESPAKRYVFSELYGDLLNPSGNRKKVLDIGGGLTSLTEVIACNHDYTLIDILAHDDEIHAQTFLQRSRDKFIRIGDWYDCMIDGEYDVIVANDLFPNVDQRLQLFLERALHLTDELRLSLTFYNDGRFYPTKRCDADEYLWVLAWNGEMTKQVIKKYEPNIINPDLGLFDTDNSSVYSNNRQVCLVTMKANASP